MYRRDNDFPLVILLDYSNMTLRCGLLMAARSMAVGATTGLVVTASHNPAQDNGVKLVEPSGYMLQQTWEVCWALRTCMPWSTHNAEIALLTCCKFLFQAHANRLAQWDDDASLQSCLQEVFTSEAIAAGWCTAACHCL